MNCKLLLLIYIFLPIVDKIKGGGFLCTTPHFHLLLNKKGGIFGGLGD